MSANEIEVLQVWSREGVWAHSRPGRPPPGWQTREQHHLGRPAQSSPCTAPTMSKKPSHKMQALELLKGDRELFLELQTRLAKPKVVLPKKKEDALLRERIEKDKAKEQQERVYNLRNDLALAETQAEENRQRVLILQSEWQALYEQAGEETDEKIELQLSQVILNLMVWRPLTM